MAVRSRADSASDASVGGFAGGRIRLIGAAGGAPAVAVFADPVEQGAFEADVVTQPLGLQPLVAKDLLSFGKELLVETRLLYKVFATGGFLRG